MQQRRTEFKMGDGRATRNSLLFSSTDDYGYAFGKEFLSTFRLDRSDNHRIAVRYRRSHLWVSNNQVRYWRHGGLRKQCDVWQGHFSCSVMKSAG
jgi:hypothetical protein